METSKAPNVLRTTWSSNWKMQRDERLVESKLSSTGNSIKMIWSQLTIQQQENTKLIEQNKKIREDSQQESDVLRRQIKDISNKGKEHVNKETATSSE
jgi:argininosuccinate lyase